MESQVLLDSFFTKTMNYTKRVMDFILCFLVLHTVNLKENESRAVGNNLVKLNEIQNGLKILLSTLLFSTDSYNSPEISKKENL